MKSFFIEIPFKDFGVGYLLIEKHLSRKHRKRKKRMFSQLLVSVIIAD